MAEAKLDRNNLEVVYEFNDAAEGIGDRTRLAAFTTAGDRLSRRYGQLIEGAATGLERGELMESMAGVLVAFANHPFNAEESLRTVEMTTRVLAKLAEAFLENVRPDTVPEFYKAEQLDYLSGIMKSAYKVRDDMSSFFPNRPTSTVISQQGREYLKFAEALDKLSVQYGGDKAKPAPEAEPRRRPRFF